MEHFLITQGTNVSFLLRLISLILCVIFVLPLMVRNTVIKNGLRPFRIMFLAIGLVGILANFQTMLFLFDLLVKQVPQRPQNANLQFTNAVYELIRSSLFYGLYRLSFNEDAIKLHQTIEKNEENRTKKNKDRRDATVEKNEAKNL